MSQVVLPFVLLAVVAAAIWVIRLVAEDTTSAPDYPYQGRATLFTPAERSFLGVLEQAVGGQFRILGKVRLADVICVRPGLAASARQQAFNRIQSKHLDFVACDPMDLSIQFAIELDDKSHKDETRGARDVFLDAAMRAAGVPLVRFPAKRSYSIDEVRQTVQAALAPEETSGAERAEAATTEAASAPGGEPEVEANTCPSCGGEMVLRKAKRGKNAGQEFWGCSNYPSCRQVRAS